MPSMRVLEALDSAISIEPSAPSAPVVPALSVVPSAPITHALSVVPSASARAAVPVAQVAISAEPTARIHWVGDFVHYRHPDDLYKEMVAGTSNLVIVDARYRETFAREHLPGAINLPWRGIDERTTAHMSREALYVVYCWNASCHASTKTARRLEVLGFKVKELHGGLETWRKQGYPTER